MKPLRKKPINKKVVARQRQSFDFKSFQSNLNSLNKDNYGSAPLAVKIFVLALIVIFILALAWFMLISPKIEEIKAVEAEQEALLETYKEKEAKARHLDVYKEQVAQMEVDFVALLSQLPQDTQVPELIEGINAVGRGSGVRFQDISVDPEIEQEFFIEQPISIRAIGDYHQFGNFVTGIARLPRIITMHDFEVVNPQPSLDTIPQLQLTLQTQTYRSKAITEEDLAVDGSGSTEESN